MYSADNIIQVNARISAAGLGFANFGSAMIIALPSEAEDVPSVVIDTYKTYASIQEAAADWPTTSETYQAIAKWLGGTPKIRSVKVWMSNNADATLAVTLNKARDVIWWYWTILVADAYAAPATVLTVAQWCEDNGSMLINNQTGASCTAIRTEATTTDIASQLTTLGYRHVYTAAHATDAQAGTALAKHFAAVNYSADNSTITGEFKKSPGVAAEDLKGTEIAAMEKASKKAVFYSVVELQGSQDVGRWLNTFTHSSYGEYIDDVVNLDAFINTLTVRLFNTLGGQTTKLPQTPVGQAALIATTRQVGLQFIDNGYLGPRNYTDPDDGLEKYTEGFEILTVPEDILDISTEDRNSRLAAPIRVRLFRAGAIHRVIVDVDIY